MELLVALAGVVVGAAGVWVNQKGQGLQRHRDELSGQARLQRLEDRLENILIAGREMQQDLGSIADRLHCLEIQVARMSGFLGRAQDRRQQDNDKD